MNQIVFDGAMAARLDAVYGARDVLRRRRLVRAALAAEPGEHVLDIGCGPGFYAAELLDDVGPDGSVTGVDLSPQMLALASRRCAARPNAAFHLADAAALPFDNAAFDAVLGVQVLEYVRDTMAALVQMRRVLRPGGRLLLWAVDWSTVSWYSADPGRMRRVLRLWDEHLAHPALTRRLAAVLCGAGFEEVGFEGHVFVSTELTPEAYAGAILPLIEQYCAVRSGLDAAEAKLWASEQRQLAERGEFFFACVQFCFTARRPA